MKYRLRAGENCLAILGGTLAGPLRIILSGIGGLVAGIFVVYALSIKEPYIFNTAYDLFPLVILGLVATFVAPLLISWDMVRKEFIEMNIDDENSKIHISWHGVFATSAETFEAGRVEGFDIPRFWRRHGGRMKMILTDGSKVDLGSFSSRDDAKREMAAANEALAAAKVSSPRSSAVTAG